MRRVIALLILFVALQAFSAQPPREPILRINTEMHTTVIKRIAVDKAERYLITGSDDKTIKVWDLKTRKLLKTLRPPMGEGDEGKIYAVAISPDGKHVAAGGWTGSWDGSYSIYIFDLKSRKLVRRISGLPEVVNHLTYSKDGKYLAVGLGESGIRIYRTSDYSLVAEDKEYGDSVYGLDFSKDGRLVVASDDGFIRLYGKDFKLLLRRKVPGGNEPYHVSFSPDGSKIAVGYDDTPNVDVLSSETLEKLYSADTSVYRNCDFGSVAFSSDGSYLYAGGACGNPKIIRRWERAGRWGCTDIPVADNTIMHILPLKDGGVVFGTWEPSFGIIDRGGRLVLKRAGEIADFRDQHEVFEVSHDGSMVKFGYGQFGKSPAIFHAEYRSFVDKQVNLLKPITSYPGLNITDWRNSYSPKLNGRPLPLKQYERSRSLATLPDGSGFLLGTEWYLRLFDKEGKEVWSIPAPSVTRVVNVYLAMVS